MIKVLNIISDTNIGGAGRSLINYLKYSDRDNFEVSVILPKNSELLEQLRPLGVKITETDGIADKSFSPGAMKELKKLIRAELPDIVHTHGSLTGRMAAKKCGVKAVFTRHSAFPFPSYVRKTPAKYLYKFLYEHYSDRIIAVSKAGAELMTDAGISPEKMEVIMNGVEPVKRISDDERGKFRKSFGVAEDELLLGVLARIEEYKGHKDMLDALKILCDKGKNVKLLIAGSGSFEEEVRDYTKKLELEEKVIFAGFIKDVAPILGVMDLQLNASFVSETSSLSLIEGMSISLPAVASDCCGNPHLIENGVNGFLFEPKNGGDLAKKVEAVIDDETLLAKLSQGALDIYNSRFTGEIYARTLEDIYRRTISG